MIFFKSQESVVRPPLDMAEGGGRRSTPKNLWDGSTTRRPTRGGGFKFVFSFYFLFLIILRLKKEKNCKDILSFGGINIF